MPLAPASAAATDASTARLDARQAHACLRSPRPNTRAGVLPAAAGEQLRVVELARLERRHGRAQALRGLGDALGVGEVRGGLDDRAGARRRVLALEDPRADEDGLGAELHDQRR